MKFLTLIQAIALLHQYQREIKTETREGKTLEYIEATEQDVALARQLVNEVLPPSLDELQPQTRRLLLLIEEMVTRACEAEKIERPEFRFSRRTVRHATQWSDSQLKRHLHRMEEMEYLIVHRGGRGQSFVYELDFELDANGKPVLPGLGCHYDANKSGREGEKSGPSLPQVRGVSGGGVDSESPARARRNGAFYENGQKNTTREIGEENPVVLVPPAKLNGVHRATAARAGVK